MKKGIFSITLEGRYLVPLKGDLTKFFYRHTYEK